MEFFGQTLNSYETVSSQATKDGSNLKKMVTLSHELMHAFMYTSLESFGIITFDIDGAPLADITTLCNGFTIQPNVNLNTYTMEDRWVYLICEFNSNNPGNQQWTHSLFDSPVFAVETYREKLEQLLINKHDWNSEPTTLQNLALGSFGTQWKEEVAEYMSWVGLDKTPQFQDWLITKNISFSTWTNSIGPWKNPDWVASNGVLHNCN